MAITAKKVMNYRYKYFTEKVLFPITSTCTKIVIKYSSNHTARNVFMILENVIDSLSKYILVAILFAITIKPILGDDKATTKNVAHFKMHQSC